MPRSLRLHIPGDRPIVIRGRAGAGALGTWYPKSRRVGLRRGQNGRCLMNTVIHEMLHVLDGAMSEREVSRRAGVLARALWGLGYRREK